MKDSHPQLLDQVVSLSDLEPVPPCTTLHCRHLVWRDGLNHTLHLAVPCSLSISWYSLFTPRLLSKHKLHTWPYRALLPCRTGPKCHRPRAAKDSRLQFLQRTGTAPGRGPSGSLINLPGRLKEVSPVRWHVFQLPMTGDSRCCSLVMPPS